MLHTYWKIQIYYITDTTVIYLHIYTYRENNFICWKSRYGRGGFMYNIYKHTGCGCINVCMYIDWHYISCMQMHENVEKRNEKFKFPSRLPYQHTYITKIKSLYLVVHDLHKQRWDLSCRAFVFFFVLISLPYSRKRKFVEKIDKNFKT